MAVCEQGYLCAVCGQDVETITESALYLSFVLGDIDSSLLDRLPERHIRCHPSLAQFIVCDAFEPIAVAGPFAKAHLDPQYVRDEEMRVTTGYLRLNEVARSDVPIWDYPLERVAREGGATGQDGPP